MVHRRAVDPDQMEIKEQRQREERVVPAALRCSDFCYFPSLPFSINTAVALHNWIGVGAALEEEEEEEEIRNSKSIHVFKTYEG